jgi:hypothetical protein
VTDALVEAFKDPHNPGSFPIARYNRDYTV